MKKHLSASGFWFYALLALGLYGIVFWSTAAIFFAMVVAAFAISARVLESAYFGKAVVAAFVVAAIFGLSHAIAVYLALVGAIAVFDSVKNR